MRENALRHVEPAIRAPGKSVEQLMAIIEAKARFEHGLFVGMVVSVGIFKEEKIGRLPDINPTVAELQTGGEIQSINKDGDFVGSSIAVGIFKDFNAVARLLPFGRTQRVFV